MTDGSTAPVVTLDRGNSTLDCMVWGAVPRRVRLDPKDTEGLDRFLAADRPRRVVGLTVVQAGLEPARQVLLRRGAPLLLAGLDLPLPLQVRYDDPDTLGMDRLVGVLAAHVRHGNAVVVDCGTALTVNLVRDGVFLGGAIAPGPDAMARGLAQSAPALPRVDLAAEVRLPAACAADAVNAGVVVGFAGLLESLVAATVAAAGLADAPHLLTGGRAGLYLDRSHGLDFEHVPDLVHQGLRWLATQA